MALTDVNSTLKNIVTNLSQLITGFNSYNAAIVTQLMKISPVGPGIPLIPASFISPGVFVETTGNDSTGDGSSGNPWLTPQHAFNEILGYDFNGAVTARLNIGAGNFDGWTIIGPARGWTGDQSTGVNTAITVVGAGSGSTNINPLVGQPNLCIGPSAGIFTAISALNVNVPGSGGNGINVNTSAVLGLGGDISFTGTGDGTGNAFFNDAFGFVVNGGDVTLKGTLETYFIGANTANYESFGNVVISGALATFANLRDLSNMHGETVTLGVGGSVTDAAYFVDTNSVLQMNSSLVPEIWDGSSSSSWGILFDGGRSDNACDVPAVNSATGLGSGSAAMTDFSSTYAIQITLSPAGSPSAAGTVIVQTNEALFINNSFAPFVLTLAANSGAWATRAIAGISSIATNGISITFTITWDNNGVNLTAGATYFINMVGQT